MSKPPGAEDAAALQARLERSRRQLLAALERLTEQDFAQPLDDGRSVLELLAGLAPLERAAAARARGTTAPEERDARAPGLAPQVIHDLAGARHETLRTLAELGSAAPSAELRAIAEREEQAAATIRARFPESGAGA